MKGQSTMLCSKRLLGGCISITSRAASSFPRSKAWSSKPSNPILKNLATITPWKATKEIVCHISQKRWYFHPKHHFNCDQNQFCPLNSECFTEIRAMWICQEVKQEKLTGLPTNCQCATPFANPSLPSTCFLRKTSRSIIRRWRRICISRSLRWKRKD